MKNTIKNNPIAFSIILAGLLILTGFIANIIHKNNLVWEARYKQTQKESQLDFCIEIADANYWSYMEINGTVDDDGVIYAENRFWDVAEDRKQTEIDNCYRRFNLK